MVVVAWSLEKAEVTQGNKTGRRSIDYLSDFSLIRTCDAMEPDVKNDLIKKY